MHRLLAVVLIISVTLGLDVWGGELRVAASASDTDSDMEVSGTVFHDYTVDGVRQTKPAATFDEPGVAGVTVRAFDATGVLVATVTTGADGAYTLDVSGAITDDVRIEFEAPDGFVSSFVGADAGPAVQFVTAGSTDVNYAVHIPDEFCEENPLIFVACFYPGSLERGAELGALMSNSWLERGKVGDAGFTPASVVLTKAQAGSVWGVALQRQTGLIFTSAVVRRHAALGPKGIGGLYVASTDGLVTAFDLAATPYSLKLTGDAPAYDDDLRGLTGTSELSLDLVGYRGVGTEGIGDIDISPDGRYLYVTNLYERTVVRFELTGDASAPALGAPQHYAVPSGTDGTELCEKETARPWALKSLQDGTVLVGVTCTDLRTYDASLPRDCKPAKDDCSNVRETHKDVLETPEPGVIARLDPAGADGAGSWAVETTVSFDYPRQTDTCRGSDDTVGSIAVEGIVGIRCRAARWHPWTDDWSKIRTAAWREHSAGDRMHFWPQPIIGDIEVLYDGSLAVGIIDRLSMQIGANNYQPTNESDPLIYTWVSGDLRLICSTDDGYVEESNGSCGDTYTSTRLEYFNDTHIHVEPLLGGLAIHPSRADGTIAATVMDPVTVNSSGVLWFDVSDGTRRKGADFIPQEDNSSTATFKKAAGMGDIEVLCDFAPIQIGDRVWFDIDGDGIQDPGEPGIEGVTVRLYDAEGTFVAETMTDAAGRYLFSSADGLRPGAAYTIRFDEPDDYAEGGPLDGFLLTGTGGIAPVGSRTDEVGSLGALVETGEYGVTTFPSILVAPLSPGVNVFRFDAGFTVPVSGSSWVMPQESPVPLLVPTGGGPRPIEELGPLLVEIAGDVGLTPGAVALAVLVSGVILLVVRQPRRRRSAPTAVGQSNAALRTDRAPGGAGRSVSGSAQRRPAVPPLFSGSDEAPDPLTSRLRHATDPLAVIEALRSVDAPATPEPTEGSEEPAAPPPLSSGRDADEDAITATLRTESDPLEALEGLRQLEEPGAIPRTSSVEVETFERSSASRPSMSTAPPSPAEPEAPVAQGRAVFKGRRPNPVAFPTQDVAPVAWMVAGGVAALLVGRWSQRNLGRM